MGRNFISGRYGSVQRLLPAQVFDSEKNKYVEKWIRDDNDWANIRGGSWKANNGQGEQPDDRPKKASLTDVGSLLEDKAYTRYGSTVSAVTSWTLENQVAAITYTASNTRGYRGKLEGTHNASGNIAGIGAIPPIAPGQRFRFYGYVGPDSGKLDNYKGTVYRITAIANSVQVQINYQLQNPCTWTVGWQSDWKVAGDELWVNRLSSEDDPATFDDYGFWDYTQLDCTNLLPSSKNCMLIEGAHRSICLLDANIQFNTETSQFTNSCSSSVGGWQSCVVGPTDCQISANIHGDNYGDLYHPDSVVDYYHDNKYSTYDDLPDSWKNRKFWAGSNHALRIYVGNNGAYWEFYKMMITNFGGLNVDTTSNNPVQFSCNMEFNAYPQLGDHCGQGYIIYNTGSYQDDDGSYVDAKNIQLVDLRAGDNLPEDKGSSIGEPGKETNGEYWTSSCPEDVETKTDDPFYSTTVSPSEAKNENS